jgi:MoxR-like ATPase
MLKKLELNHDVEYYYDTGEKIIARYPTASNLKQSGADNSLYLGMIGNKQTQKAICKIFEKKDISEIKGLKFQTSSNNGKFNTELNINAEGQIQINVGKNEMCKFYGLSQEQNNLVVIDFKNNVAYKETIDRLKEKFNSYEGEFLQWMRSQPERYKPKKDGRDSQTLQRYVRALKKVNEWFGIGLSKEVFCIKDTDELDEVLRPVFLLQNFKDINRYHSFDFSASAGAYREFLQYEKEQEEDESVPTSVTYSEDDFFNRDKVYLEKDEYHKLINLLLYKKNVVLKGAPGVGKTYIAKKLAYSINREKNDYYIDMVQFHQNYSYEDFVMGYKPKEEGFELEKGIFYQFCKKAENDENKNHKYFFIIDEINRGNLSKIFGELMMLIENDKRGFEYRVKLAYKEGEEAEEFFVPENVYIIGTMNTADRSLTKLDYALRRRFSFFSIKPAFEHEKFIEYQQEINNSTFDKLIETIKDINKKIEEDESLGEGYKIGHSYFCGLKNDDSFIERIESIVKYDIIPTLEEYWFDNKPVFDDAKRKLEEVF